jgi:predicted permease
MMSAFRRFLLRVVNAFRPGRAEADLAREVTSHLGLLEDEFRRRGMSTADARLAAKRAFGNVEQTKERHRDERSFMWLDGAGRDVQYAVRMLRKAPTFAVVAILTIGLGVGANTAVFSLMESVVWRPLAVRAPHRLRLMTWVSGPNDVMTITTGPTVIGRNGARLQTPFSYAAFLALRKHTSVLADLCAFRDLSGATAVIAGQAEPINADLISGSFYETLGVTPAIGRPVEESDDAPGAAAVGVLSHAFWSRRFGGSAGVIGERMDVNGVSITIVGVNPADFSGATTAFAPDIFLPLHLQPAVWPNRYIQGGSMVDDAAAWWLSVIGRLAPSVSDGQAQKALDLALRSAIETTLADRARRDQPRLRLVDGTRGVDELGGEFGYSLHVLWALTGFVLLLACVNLANLLLARADGRRRELAVRLAIGAGRARLARQLVTEGMVLAVLGGFAALAIGNAARNVIPSVLGAPWLPRPFEGSLDAPVLGATIALTLLTGLLVSVAPVWRAIRAPLNNALKDSGRTTGARTVAAGRLFVAVQVAVSVVLLASAGLFIRTLINLDRTHLGFDPDHVVLFSIDPPHSAYDGPARVALFERLEQAIGALPGVLHVSLSSSPLVGHDTSTTLVGADGRYPPRDAARKAWINDVGQDFFRTMGISIVKGRGFQKDDGTTSEPVVVVNQAFVRTFFPSGDALGHAVVLDRGSVSRIVGVIEDTPFFDLRRAPPPTVLRPYRQLCDVQGMTFEIATDLPLASLVASVRQVVHRVDPQVPISDVRTQGAQIASTVSRERLFALLTVAFGLLAVTLTCLGVYAIVANVIARRTAEVGLRMALGAHPTLIVLMLVRQTALAIGLGLAAGFLCVLDLGRYFSSLLYGVGARDPITLSGAVLLAFAAGIIAAAVPARRAARLSPLDALGHES